MESDGVWLLAAAYYRAFMCRFGGSLLLQLLSKTKSRLLLAKLLSRLGIDFFQNRDTFKGSAGITVRFAGH